MLSYRDRTINIMLVRLVHHGPNNCHLKKVSIIFLSSNDIVVDGIITKEEKIVLEKIM